MKRIEEFLGIEDYSRREKIEFVLSCVLALESFVLVYVVISIFH